MTNTILETFQGVVDYTEDNVAFFTLISDLNGDKLIGEYPYDILNSYGIFVNRRFILHTVQTDYGVELEFKSIPDCEINSRIMKRIDEEINELVEEECEN